jgi:hypothetical protein
MSKKFADVEVYKPELQILAGETSIMDKVRFILKTSNSILININEFTDLLKSTAFLPNTEWFNPISDRKVLITGHYADIDGKPVYINKMVPPGEYADSQDEIEKIKEKGIEMKKFLFQEGK